MHTASATSPVKTTHDLGKGDRNNLITRIQPKARDLGVSQNESRQAITKRRKTLRI